MKMLMAVSGALFVFYVLAHMYGNLKIFAGVEAFDEYADHLRTMFTPILPFGGFLWLFRVVLVAGARGPRLGGLLPVEPGTRCPHDALRRQGGGPGHGQEQDDALGGVALLLFLVWHLLQFTIVKFNVGRLAAGGSPGLLVISSFQVWWVVLIYLLALVALGLHLYHGVWSAPRRWAGPAAPRPGAARKTTRSRSSPRHERRLRPPAARHPVRNRQEGS